MLYGTSNRPVYATYEGYITTGQMPAYVYFRLSAAESVVHDLVAVRVAV